MAMRADIAFTVSQWLRGQSLDLIRKMVGHSPRSRVAAKNDLHMPTDSVRAAVLDLNVLAGEVK
jgi:hypothetical protein